MGNHKKAISNMRKKIANKGQGSIRLKLLLTAALLLIFSTLAFALSYKSPNFTLKNARIVSSGGWAHSANFCVYNVCLGASLGGEGSSQHYGLSAEAGKNIELVSAPDPPILNPVTSPTNIPEQILSGRKPKLTSIYINGKLCLPLDGQRSWSYNYPLTEGQNHLYINCRNKAGLESKPVFAAIQLKDPATLIGPEGGVVVSTDGLVKAVFPAGALSEPVYISLLSPDKNSFQDATPQDYSLLNVVECLPQGLNFLKPVDLIYTLAQAEIPGTPVGLGLRSRQEEKISLTGISSTVEADGYTVRFAVRHFSDYAALKNLIPQDASPIGSGVKVPLPDIFTGAFGHMLALSLPAGRQNMQPNLALSYKSTNPNSWLGAGFSLNAGYIVRSTKFGVPSYNDTEDTFYLVTDSGSTELVHLVDNLYQARAESDFTKFYKEKDCWRVVQKNGATMFFGQGHKTRQWAPKGTYSWYLTKAVDTNQNFIRYNYVKIDEQPYLETIFYTGNEKAGFSPTHKVEFLLEERPDTPSSCISGGKILISRRLAEIQVRINERLIWRYELEYAQSPDTGRSLLKSVTQYAADGRKMPQKTFKYQSAKDN